MNSKVAPPESERRRHQRYHLPAGLRQGPLLTAVDQEGNKMAVMNWSYGGLRVAGGVQAFHSPGTGPFAVSLGLHLAQEYIQPALVQVVGRATETVSLSFVHSGPEALLFMRPWMEHLRMGSSMTELGSAVMKKELLAEGWRVWRGDGPVTLSIKGPNWRMVIPDQGAYVEIGVGDGKLWQRHMVDPDERISPRMAGSDEIDTRFKDAAILTLVGSMDGGFPADLGLGMIDRLKAD
jgi:hypothetical protein